jgi:RNA processing factor Prp31
MLSENLACSKAVKLMAHVEYQVTIASFLLTALAGFRTNAATTGFAAILPEEWEAAIKAATEISIGIEISESDPAHIHAFSDQVISISEYRAQLSVRMRNRMIAFAPNLTACWPSTTQVEGQGLCYSYRLSIYYSS